MAKTLLRLRRGLWCATRQAIFLLLVPLTGAVAWMMLASVRRWWRADFLFLVYPGTDRDLSAYCPPRLARSRWFRGRPVLVGLVLGGANAGTGLVLAVPHRAEEFAADPDLGRLVLARVCRIREQTGARSVALAGRLPGILARQGVELPGGFVDGRRGTVCAIKAVLDAALRVQGRRPQTARAVVVGKGFSGEAVTAHLAAAGYQVVGVDGMRGATREAVAEAANIILLSAAGVDFLPWMDVVPAGTWVLDDTHPPLKRMRNHYHRVRTVLRGARILPRLPGFRDSELPGCVVEAMCVARVESAGGLRQEQFNRLAASLGFMPVAVGCAPSSN